MGSGLYFLSEQEGCLEGRNRDHPGPLQAWDTLQNGTSRPSQFQEPEGGPEVWDPEEGPQWPRTKGSALRDTIGKEQ